MPNDRGTGQRKRSEARLLDRSEGLVINTVAKGRQTRRHGRGDAVKLSRRAIFNGKVRLALPILGCWSPLETLKAADSTAQIDIQETRKMRVASWRSWSCIAGDHAIISARIREIEYPSSWPSVWLLRVSGHCAVSQSMVRSAEAQTHAWTSPCRPTVSK